MTVPGNLSSPLLATAAAAAGAGANITKSVRFNSADSAHLNRTPSSAGSNTTWTLSTWVKKTGNDNHIFGAGAGNTPGRFGFGFNGSDKIFALVVASGSTVFQITTDAVFRDSSAWYHLVLIADTGNSTQADRFKIYVNGVLQSVSGTLMPSSQNTFVNTTAAHVIGRRSYNTSDPFNGYLADFYLIDGSALAPTSFGAFDDNGVWQASSFSGSFGTNGFHLFDFANEATLGHDSSGNENDFTVNNISQASLITWSNGWSNNLLAGFPATNCFNGTGTGLTIGGSNVKSTWTAPSSIPFTTLSIRGAHDGANINVNGTDVTSQFSSGLSVVTVTGISSPLTSIDLDNTNGQGNARISAIRIDGELLADDAPYPGAGNDVLFDVPTNGDSSDDTGAGGELSSNYCVWNALDKNSNVVLTNGNLEASPSGGNWSNVRGTIGVSSGKWYWEIKVDSLFAQMLGVATNSDPLASWFGGAANQGAVMKEDGQVWVNQTSVTDLGSFAAGDIIGIGLDLDGNTIQFYKNGSSMGSAVSITGGRTYFPIAILYGSSDKQTANWGQRAFVYGNAGTNRPAATFKALCTSNLPTPTIADGSDYFNAITYTGDAVNDRTITTTLTTVGAVWIKRRDVADNHRLATVVQGGNAWLSPNLTGAENNATSIVRAFSGNTFDIGTDTSVNASSGSHIAWAWDAGTSNASNTDGSITSSVRANIASGFSIVTWTGTGAAGTVGHGLGVKPEFIFTHRRSGSGQWPVYHSGIGATKYMYLNSDIEARTYQHFWNNTEPTSSVFSIGNDADVSASGGTHIAYCFAPVAGYSAIGEFTSNNTTDNVFLYTGFAPRYLLWKIYNTSGGWSAYDAARDPVNPNNTFLRANSSDAESTATPGVMDFLSNGFKIRNTLGGANSLVYIAFAENPFQANGGLAR